MQKLRNYILPTFQNKLKSGKTSYYFNDSKERRMVSSCGTQLPLLRGITSRYNGDFCCLNCLHSFRTKKKNFNHIKKCENKHICNNIVLLWLEFNQHEKSDKAHFIIQILNVW